MTQPDTIVTITLNPAIDQTVFISGFSAGKVNRVDRFRRDAGGKGVNVAAFLADYGLPVTATGFLGKENPHLFERFFDSKKISDQFLRISGSTRTGIKIIDDVNQHTTDINFPGQAPTADDLGRLMAMIDAMGNPCRWFVIAGSIPAGTPTEIYKEMVEAIVQKGGVVAVDASGEGFRQAISARPALIKPNIDELQEWVGQPLDTQAEIIHAARRLLDTGIETVVVSMGQNGALFVKAHEIIRAVPPQVTVQSTVGAGDAMLSGMVAGKIERRPLTACARLATAFSVVAVTHIGAGLNPKTALASIEEQVQIQIIDH